MLLQHNTRLWGFGLNKMIILTCYLSVSASCFSNQRHLHSAHPRLLIINFKYLFILLIMSCLF